MVERRFIRVLVTFNKTNYFVDKAEQHGATYEAGKLFEAFLNDRLKTRNIKVNLVFIPVSRDRLFPALAEGRGDIAAAGLTITRGASEAGRLRLAVHHAGSASRSSPGPASQRSRPRRICPGERCTSGSRARPTRTSRR